MIPKGLRSFSGQDREDLLKELLVIQNGKCFIADETIDLVLHKHDVDVDHVVPLSLGGKDDKSNFALTFNSANRSKQDADLNVARVIHHFYKLKKRAEGLGRSPNLDDILQDKGGAQHALDFTRGDESISYTFSRIGRNEIITSPVFTDKLSKCEYFFALLPIEYVYHDDVINPRSIGKNVAGLIKEFYSGNPQLHVALGWINIEGDGNSRVLIFDGQHKTAAQLLVGVREIAVRIFINPDKDRLVQTNFKAGTSLRQVAFDKSVQRHLGNTIYTDLITQYQKERGLDEDNFNFSEIDLIAHFKGKTKEIKRYIADAQRYKIKQDSHNKLNKYIDDAGRGTQRPLSYSTIEKTFFSFFINGEPLASHISYGLEDGKNPREIEQRQIVEIMNIFAEEILIDKFDFDIGTSRLENRILKKESLPLDHIRACRMCKEEIVYTWLELIRDVIRNHWAWSGDIVDQKSLLQTEFSDILRIHLRNAIINIGNLPFWKNTETSIFDGRRNTAHWRTVFATGKTADGVLVLAEGVNLRKIIEG